MTQTFSLGSARDAPVGVSPKPARIALYAFLVVSALIMFVPLYVMILTSLKPMSEIRAGNILALPIHPTLEAWASAWNSACSGLTCVGLKSGLWHSIEILVPAVAISVLLSSLTGYALSFWRVRGAYLLFSIMMTVIFVPYQVFIYPLVRLFALAHVHQSIATVIVVHIVFSLPTQTLLFRNYFLTLPLDLFKAARVDGASFFQIYSHLFLPMATPMIAVAVILQVTGIWNDFLFGLVFAGSHSMPMTVQLNNIVNSDQGERLYNVNMAATLLTALVPLLVYFVSGRWFVRGIAAGAVKG